MNVSISLIWDSVQSDGYITHIFEEPSAFKFSVEIHNLTLEAVDSPLMLLAIRLHGITTKEDCNLGIVVFHFLPVLALTSPTSGSRLVRFVHL